MKKDEMKKILKPLIRECIKEVIFEDGILSSVISEVMLATGGLNTSKQKIEESPAVAKQKENVGEELHRQKLQEQKKKMLDAIGKEAFNGVNIFEGTTPAPSDKGGTHGPLAGTSPNDPGVDISNFAKNNVWKKLAGN